METTTTTSQDNDAEPFENIEKEKVLIEMENEVNTENSTLMAAAAAAATETQATENSQTSDAAWDVIVIGAGISGLTSAYTLKKKAPNLKILIIEANDRVGGKHEHFFLV
jgi:heterodisulfide reductase subunit A-like polyferredoxin